LSPLPNGDILNSNSTMCPSYTFPRTFHTSGLTPISRYPLYPVTPLPLYPLIPSSTRLTPSRHAHPARPSDTGPCPTSETRPTPHATTPDVFRSPADSPWCAPGVGQASLQMQQTPHRRSSPYL